MFVSSAAERRRDVETRGGGQCQESRWRGSEGMPDGWWWEERKQKEAQRHRGTVQDGTVRRNPSQQATRSKRHGY